MQSDDEDRCDADVFLDEWEDKTKNEDGMFDRMTLGEHHETLESATQLKPNVNCDCTVCA